MVNPQAPMQINRHYFYEESNSIVYYTEDFPDDLGALIHLGDSDNPKPKSAVAAFLQSGKISTGYRLKNLDQ